MAIELVESKTVVISNGSKWAGESPDSIPQLIIRLKEFTIQEIFFEKMQIGKNPETDEPIYGNINPISISGNTHRFHGNFEEVSAVFNIYTTDSELILTLSRAIKENRGWKLYYEKKLVKKEPSNQLNLFGV